MKITSCTLDYCLECGICIYRCPKKCISMKLNNLGEGYPQIDNSRCIRCGICNSICPMNKVSEGVVPQKVFAAWAKDKNVRQKVSSGGAAYFLYRRFIEKYNGIVYGPVFNNHQELVFQSFSSLDQLNQLIGSKYVFSKMGKIYLKIEEQLKKGNKILFIGMPCQVSALKNYLKVEYNNLFTVDLICHGMPPNYYFQEHLKSILSPKQLLEVSKISFRKNHKYILQVYANEGECIYKSPDYLDTYLLAYSRRMICKEACYNCLYAKTKRISDITIGDFWGIDNSIEFDEKVENGVSCVLINTEEGSDLFKMCHNDMDYRERTLKEALAENETLKHPMLPNSYRIAFVNNYKIGNFENTIKKILFKTLLRNKMCSLIPDEVKRRLKYYIFF